jgi:hypothetical protein
MGELIDARFSDLTREIKTEAGPADVLVIRAQFILFFILFGCCPGLVAQNYIPTVDSLNPVSSTGLSQIFTFTFSDLNGFQDLNILNILINNSIDGRQACYLAYVRSASSLLLVNDAGSAGGPFAGMALPGPGSISNSQCTVNGVGSSATSNGNSLTLTLNITFSQSFAGYKIVFAAARDNATPEGNSGWVPMGTHMVPPATPAFPSPISINPSAGRGAAQSFTLVYQDATAATNLATTQLLINDALDGRNACYLGYVLSSNLLVLVNDAGAAGGPYAGILVLGTPGAISNSQCTVESSGTSANANGQTLTLTVNVSFSPTFTGRKIAYLGVQSSTANSGWYALGAWVAGGSLNGHIVWGDPTNNNALLSWITPQSGAFVATVTAAANFLSQQVPTDPANGLAAYYTHSLLTAGDPPTISDYVYNPAGLLSMTIDSGIAWQQFSGDSSLLTISQQLADFQLVNGLTSASAVWASVPYASSTASTIPYDGSELGALGVVEPDKIGEVGFQLARLYEVTGNQNYLRAAIHDADVLAAMARSGDANNSPWPFRVDAQTGTVLNPYTADVIRPVQLFDELIKLQAGTPANYVQARTTAWAWLMTYPMQNNVWANYFEDIPDDITNFNQYVPLETARYLLLNPSSDPNSLTKAQSLISWVESNFAIPQFGANTIIEQFKFPVTMGSHTARYGSVMALLARATSDASIKDKALRSLNWATYMLSNNGQVITGPDDPTEIWFTDGYGDYIRHFLSAMSTFPEWAGR